MGLDAASVSEEVFEAIARASSGFVESPAGCGKTEAIVRAVGLVESGRQLVLTHTNAGVDVLRQRFRKQNILRTKFHVDTIAGWAWGWVRRYPKNAGYQGSTDIAVWGEVYESMANLLQRNFAKQGVLNSYAGVIVDEYQDCTKPMHHLITQLKRILPCRVLGDDLQGIFTIGEEALVDWADVKVEFEAELGTLETPHRWIKAGNKELGDWLLRARPVFRNNNEPDYRDSPIDRREITFQRLPSTLLSLLKREGRTCFVAPKARSLHASIETLLAKHGCRVLEPNELAALRKVVEALAHGSHSEKVAVVRRFLKRAYSGLVPDEKAFLEKILTGQMQKPLRPDRRRLCNRHMAGITPHLLLELLEYIECLGTATCKLRESVSGLKCVLEGHLANQTDLRVLYADEVARRKYQNRSKVYRCIGSTLLVKGLEFDHVIVLRNKDWQKNWGTYKDLYVALTRGSRTATLIDLA